MHRHAFFRSRYIFSLIATFAVVLHLWMSYITFHYPYLGIGVKQDTAGNWVVAEFYAGGIAERSGLRINDRIAAIDSKPPDQHFSVRNSLSIEQAFQLEVTREGNVLEVAFLDDRNLLETRAVVTQLAGLLAIIIAIFIYIKAQRKAAADLLVLGFVCIGLAFLSTESAARSDSISAFVSRNAVPLTPILIIHYMYQLLKEKGQVFFSFKWIRLCYWIVSVLGAMRLLYFTRIERHLYNSWDRDIVLISFAAGCLMNMVFLLYVYIKRRQEYSYSAEVIKTAFVAFGFTFVPFVCFSVIPDLLGIPFVDYTVTYVFIAIFPIVFLHRAFKKGLFGPRPLQFVHNMTFRIGGLLFQKHPSIIGINRAMVSLSQIKKLTDLESHFLPEIAQALRSKSAAVCMRRVDNYEWAVYGELDTDSMAKVIAKGSWDGGSSHIIELVNNQEYAAYFIIDNNSKVIGNTIFEKGILLFRPLLLLALENMYLSKRLSISVDKAIWHMSQTEREQPERSLWLEKHMFRLQELERSRIASDLHDTVMQDIYFAKQKLLMLIDEKVSSQSLSTRLQELADYLDIINMNAREAAFQLYPSQLQEAGFVVALSHLVEYERESLKCELLLKIEHSDMWDLLPEDVRLQLFRICQELLANARKHSQASRVELRLYKGNSHYFLNYEDNGIGFEQATTKTSMGWAGMERRAVQIGAQLKAETSIGQGLKVTIALQGLEGQNGGGTDSNTYY